MHTNITGGNFFFNGDFIKKEYIIYIVVAVIIVVGVVGYLLLSAKSGSTLIGKPVAQSTILSLQQIASNNTLAAQVGPGVALAGGSKANIPKLIKASPLTLNGKPEILYVGGDFCPYCGVTRWALVLALMRFGSFSGLTYMESSATDVYSNTATFTFTNYSYQSNLVAFKAFEIYARNESPINASGYSTFDQALVNKYGQGVPFVDFANESVQNGATVSPQYLSGENWDQIIAALNSSGSPIAQAVIGNANIFTAQICMSNSTLNSTAPVCKQGYVKTLINGGS